MDLSGKRAPLILSIDAGTSSCRASLFDARAQRVDGASSRVTYSPRFTAEGGAELDADVLVEQVATTIDRVAALAGPALAGVGAVAVASFWHSLVGIGADGRAVTPVLPWMDARSRGSVASLRRLMDEREVHSRTGCVLHWGYLPAKLLWLREKDPGMFSQVRQWTSFGEYLMLRFTGRILASVSMASATGLFNQHTLDWDDAILERLPIDKRQLPGIASPEERFLGLRGGYAIRWPALDSVPWLPVLGDGACSNLGAGCATRERFALMVGTSGALRALWSADEVTIPWGLWCYMADRQRPVMGGALNDGGSLFAWLIRSLKLPSLDALEREVAQQPPDSHGLTILPFWAGERSPGWAADASGGIVGLRLSTTPAQIVRAALEAVALRFILLDELLRREVPESRELVATGGALLRSPAWMQIMSDALGRPLIASGEKEATSRGAAVMALESLGILERGVEPAVTDVEGVFEPVAGRTERYRAALERQVRLYATMVEGK